jgi:G:T-mismatch repair DNA endonuclease (very short patch repair protein)
MDKFSKQQRHNKAAIKQEQSDAGISSAEREQARRSANMAAIRSKDTKPERILCKQSGKAERKIHGSECCKIPKTDRDFWVAKIRRNKERDKEEQKKLAAMGWHCITVWECELTPPKRDETLESIAFTLNHIWLQDHGAKAIPYPKLDEEDLQMPMAAEESLDARR